MRTEIKLKRAVEKGLCTGCGLCAGLSESPDQIRMAMNRSGFLRPIINGPLPEKLAQDLESSCPALFVSHDKSVSRTSLLWGPVVKSRTGHSLDAEILQLGSSGGVVSSVAWHLLRTGKVDAVLQIAPSPADPLVNAIQVSLTKEDVMMAAGSRYAPAAPLADIESHLKGNRRFAFVGKPCDVAALRQYVARNPHLKDKVPFFISFMCAGVPSIKGTHEVLDAMGAGAKALSSFRYRGDGWPGMARAVTLDGQSFEMDYNTSWGKILGKHLQFRCKICPDGVGEFADIVCADAWYGKDGYPDFAERDGRSLILTRTLQGESLIQAMVLDGSIQVEPLAEQLISVMQPYQVTRKKMVLGRVLATKLALRQAPRYRRLGLLRLLREVKILDWLRQAWGTYRRAAPEVQ